MKIKNLKIDNFVKFTDFEIEFDGKITNLVGVNGSGKTTVGLTAIWACLKGISEKNTNDQLIGEKYRFIGDSRPTADIELTLFDEEYNAEIKIRNHISKDANKIKFDAPDGYKIDAEWITNLFSVAFLSAKNFTQKSSKEQAILLGIDTSKFDTDMKNIKQDFTIINRQIRDMGEIKSAEKAENVSINRLLNEKNRIDAFNNQQSLNECSIGDCKTDIRDNKTSIDELLEEIENHKAAIKRLENKIKSTEEPKAKIDVQTILDKLNSADETNNKAS